MITTEVVDDATQLARRAAEFVADRARAAVADHGSFTFAVSGGRTPWAMFAELAHEDVPWSSVVIYQVDERVAPEGDPDRNLTHLRDALTGAATAAAVKAMPVNSPDLATAARAYASELPATFDLVHLGMGPDGHTASLVPNDPVLDVTDSDVGVTQPYMGHQRMTLTFRALDRAKEVVWLISGADKVVPLRQLYARDVSIPAGRVAAANQVVFADKAAAGQ
jgi:6-phosphogluconolactonase